jgi:hypothetical protein
MLKGRQLFRTVKVHRGTWEHPDAVSLTQSTNLQQNQFCDYPAQCSIHFTYSAPWKI